MKRIFTVLFCLCIFIMIVSCTIEPPFMDTNDALSLTSGEHSTFMLEEDKVFDAQPSQEELLWAKRWEECPVATEIWLQMKSYGWTDAACAGIMGNIMRETGGDTLVYIRSDIYNKSKSHYGLCQWAKRYYPDIQPTDTWTPSTTEQVEFLRYTILNQKTLHHSYGFTEEYLLTATDYREVAKRFCDGYERPAEDSTRRENNAEKAWKYFVLGEEI